MMENMPSRLLDEWIAFFSLEPFGAFQDEYRMATVTSMIANTARDDKEKPKPYQPTDFMREVFTNEVEKSPEEVMQKLSNIFSGFGAKRLPGT